MDFSSLPDKSISPLSIPDLNSTNIYPKMNLNPQLAVANYVESVSEIIKLIENSSMVNSTF